MFFKEFPVVPYPFYLNDQRNYALARNIIRRVAFSERINNQVAFTDYDIKDGERPDQIANRLYGNSNYHWLILLANDIVDPYYGWYMSQSTIEQYIQQKYSGVALYFTDSFGGFTSNSEFFSDCTIEQNGRTQPIKNYRDTFCEFVIESPVIGIGSAVVHRPSGATNSVYIQKTLPYYQGVHHFQIERPSDGTTGASGAQQYPVVDPISRQTSDYEEVTPVLGTNYPPLGINGVTGAVVQMWETYIGKYMGVSGDEVNSYSISNYKHEQDTNESKRTIKVLNPAFLKQAMTELRAAMGV